MKRDLTQGSVSKALLSFSLPYLLSYFLQTLYGMADLYITGKYCRVDNITAVTNGSQLMHMITVVIVGLAMGTTVMIGHSEGEKNHKKTALCVGNSTLLFAVFSVLLSAALILSCDRIMQIMSVPAEAVPFTRQYLIICFAGIPFITAYNVLSSVFRGMGDSKTPLFIVFVACCINIGLDFVFIGAIKLAAAGAALGTTISQSVSVVIALIIIKKKRLLPSIDKSSFKLNNIIMKGLLKIGIPIAVQDGFIQIAFLVITVIANRRSLDDAAAVGVVEKLIGILFLVPSSMLSSVSALSAINIGAKRHDRARQILRQAILVCTCFGLVSAVGLQFFAREAVWLFVKEESVIMLGAQYLRGYVWDCIFAGIHFCFSGYFCALGRSGLSFMHNCIAILSARIPLAYLASIRFPDNLFPMGLATTTGSLVSVMICIIAYIVLTKKQKA